MNKYVIIGAGIAGIEAAKAIRERDSGGLINIFTCLLYTSDAADD